MEGGGSGGGAAGRDERSGGEGRGLTTVEEEGVGVVLRLTLSGRGGSRARVKGDVGHAGQTQSQKQRQSLERDGVTEQGTRRKKRTCWTSFDRVRTAFHSRAEG